MIPYIMVEPKQWSEMIQAMEENARLKEEVKLLTAEVSFDKRVQLHVDKLVAEFTQCQVEKLKAEVERLRKAGDEVIQEWSSGDEKEARNFMKALVIWNAAKEGKQP